jgi:universal stress protein A
MRAKSKQTVRRSGARRRRGGSQAAASSLGRILVPIDFSGKSRQALEFAVPLAERYGGRVFLIHVVQPPAISTWQVIPGGEHYLAMDMSRMGEAARKELARLAARHIPARLRGRTLVRQGNPYSQITEAARQLKVDLIVMSTHGHTGMRRMLIGSVAERVVRHAPCAVLTIRRH